MTTEDSKPAAGPTDLPAAGPRTRARLSPPVWVWLVVIFTAVLIATLRTTGIMGDNAVTNIATLIVAFLALVSVIIWFSFFSGYGRLVRMAPLVGGVGFITVFFIVFRIEHVSGEMVPSFAYRFGLSPDQRLDAPRIADSGDGPAPVVDLLTTTEHDFSQFLGPTRSCGIDGVALARDWTAQPPKLLWKQKIGAGWSSFSVVNGFAVTLEQRGRQEIVTCYEVKSGDMLWWHSIDARHSSQLGGIGPRSTPTIHQGKVYTFGATGWLHCLAGSTGKVIWSHDILAEFNVSLREDGRYLPYGRASSPLIVDDLVILPAGGPAEGTRVSLVAYQKDTGKQVWQSGDCQVSFCSPTLATIAGTRQILIVNEDYASGHEVATGKLLWQHGWPGKSYSSANVAQPVPIGENRILLTKAYGGGAALLEITPVSSGPWQVEEVWHRTVMKTKFTNVVVRDGYVYGLDDGILQCIDLESGRKKWKRGRYGHGQILRVRDLLLIQAESGEVALVEISPKRLIELGRFQAIEGKTWNNPCLYGEYLLVRNAEEAACYRLPLASSK